MGGWVGGYSRFFIREGPTPKDNTLTPSCTIYAEGEPLLINVPKEGLLLTFH